MLDAFREEFVQIAGIKAAGAISRAIRVKRSVGQFFIRCLLPERIANERKLTTQTHDYAWDKNLLEAFLSGLLDIELLGEGEVSVVDSGISHQERHSHDRGQRVELTNPDKDERHNGGHH